jgi:hypothetical protein
LQEVKEVNGIQPTNPAELSDYDPDQEEKEDSEVIEINNSI